MKILREIDSSTESSFIPEDDCEKEHIAVQQTKKESISIPWIKSDLVRPHNYTVAICVRACVCVCVCVCACACVGVKGEEG